MSKDKYYQLVVSNNEYFAAALFLTLHGNNIEDSEKQEMVINIEF